MAAIVRRKGGGLLPPPMHAIACKQTCDYTKTLTGRAKPLKRTKTDIINLEPSSPQKLHISVKFLHFRDMQFYLSLIK